MQFTRFAVVLASSISLVTANSGGVRSAIDDDKGVAAAAGSNPAPPTFLRDGDDFGNPFKCKRTQNMCDKCSRDCGCTTGNCSWNFVCYGQNRKGNNGCVCKLDSDCVSGRCSKFFKCADKVTNGGGCMEDDDCKSRRCSKGFRCYDQLEKGQGCFEDDDCKSGRCASNFKCAAKLKNGESCMADDDCEERNCAGWGISLVGTCREGGCTKSIPFMATNVKIQYDGQETFFGFHGESFENEFNFFKDVDFCPDAGSGVVSRIYGTKVSPQEFKWEVEKYLKASKGLFDHVLYAVHGFQNAPKDSFDQGYDFISTYAEKEQGEKIIGNNAGYLTIPICWRNKWGVPLLSYDYDRNNFAPVAGKALASGFDVFDSSYKASLVVHSQGNYVLRIMAQNIGETIKRKQVFENIFMVAADARSDMFSTDFNPDAPKNKSDAVALHPLALTATACTGAYNDLEQVYLELPEDETKCNGGYAITLLTKHVHVLWNEHDKALLAREVYQIPCLFCDQHEFRNALGKYGYRAEEIMELPYFKERVKFHNFSRKVTGDVSQHGYAWEEAAVNVYKEEKTPKRSNETIWKVGGYNKSCGEICGEIGMACDSSVWTYSLSQLEDRLNKAGEHNPKISHGSWKKSSGLNPAYLSETKEWVLGKNAPDCHTKESQRIGLCHCTVGKTIWKVGGAGISCDESCGDIGMACDSSVWTTSLSQLEDRLNKAGEHNPKISQGSWKTASGLNPAYLPETKEWVLGKNAPDCHSKESQRNGLCHCTGSNVAVE